MDDRIGLKEGRHETLSYQDIAKWHFRNGEKERTSYPINLSTVIEVKVVQFKRVVQLQIRFSTVKKSCTVKNQI